MHIFFFFLNQQAIRKDNIHGTEPAQSIAYLHKWDGRILYFALPTVVKKGPKPAFQRKIISSPGFLCSSLITTLVLAMGYLKSDSRTITGMTHTKF